ncbi:MAG: hypothetical protein KDK30_09030 [Leptospiraceae bacterium]|nr:hypothetical protein [Leptospiraceae bacterium]MCB1314428.1 hypothetical protein [Leptospiraceae bacterium]
MHVELLFKPGAGTTGAKKTRRSTLAGFLLFRFLPVQPVAGGRRATTTTTDSIPDSTYAFSVRN